MLVEIESRHITELYRLASYNISPESELYRIVETLNDIVLRETANKLWTDVPEQYRQPLRDMCREMCVQVGTCHSSKKIQAIKAMRGMFSLSLSEARHMVEVA